MKAAYLPRRVVSLIMDLEFSVGFPSCSDDRILTVKPVISQAFHPGRGCLQGIRPDVLPYKLPLSIFTLSPLP